MKSKKIKLIVVGFLFLAMILLSFGTLLQNSGAPTNSSQNQFQNQSESQTKQADNNVSNLGNKLIYFYGQGCPHCAKVDEFLKSNPPKFNLEKKEVYYNQSNQKDLMAAAQNCGFKTIQIGVPFLWTGKDCIVGDEPIINYFKNLNNNL
ncbi:MAG: hypothetical protein ACPL3E_02240 [Minisyncoccia bacterium]